MQDILNDLQNFDASQGKPKNNNSRIPAGSYNVMLDGVTHGVGKNSDRDFLAFYFKVLDGKYAGREETIFPNLARTKRDGSPMNKNYLESQLSLVMVIAYLCGLDPQSVPKTYTDAENETVAYEELFKMFNNCKGKTMQIKITEQPNKKNPDNPWRNYTFSPAEQPKKEAAPADPFKDQKSVDVSDNDLPF